MSAPVTTATVAPQGGATQGGGRDRSTSGDSGAGFAGLLAIVSAPDGAGATATDTAPENDSPTGNSGTNGSAHAGGRSGRRSSEDDTAHQPQQPALLDLLGSGVTHAPTAAPTPTAIPSAASAPPTPPTQPVAQAAGVAASPASTALALSTALAPATAAGATAATVPGVERGTARAAAPARTEAVTPRSSGSVMTLRQQAPANATLTMEPAASTPPSPEPSRTTADERPAAGAVPQHPFTAHLPDTAVLAAQAAAPPAPPAATPATGVAPAAATPYVTDPQPTLAASITRLRARGDGTHEITAMLHPADLGSVHVRATLHGEHLAVTVACADEAARAAVTAALPALHHQLGVTVSIDLHPGDRHGHDTQPQPRREAAGDDPRGHDDREPDSRARGWRARSTDDTALDRWM